MKYLDEYRDPGSAHKLAAAIGRKVTRPWTIMEICGGQTHSIVRHRLDTLLPSELQLVHGPGCPVCVTPLELVDRAIGIAAMPDVIFCSYGDMLRVPGSRSDLLTVKASGGQVRVVYSPLDCLDLAEANPDKTVVFFAVGFETTAPANAMAVWQAEQRRLSNFATLVSHVRVPPAIEAILSSPENRVEGFLAAGHVCTVMGYHEYEPLAKKHGVPIVVTGFEPLDLLSGIHQCVNMLEEGRIGVSNQYRRFVCREGNRGAQELVNRVFEISSRKWRGIGEIPDSGLRLRPEFSGFDAERRFPTADAALHESQECISGRILQGVSKPTDCPAFGVRCTPRHPLGATMVSSEGACAAYYHYGRPPTADIDDLVPEEAP